jgi:predicted O-methyltransferase YrrM
MDTIKDDRKLHALLSELHQDSEEELAARARSIFGGSEEEFGRLAHQYEALAPKSKGRFLREHGLSFEGAAYSESANMSLSISPEMGDFLHNLVLAVRPATVLELGSSRGVSTLYLAAAVRRLGTGKVTATEISPDKCSLIRSSLSHTGLAPFVDLREGDVFETIATFEEPFDFIFLDVYAGMYLPVMQKMEPLLRSGTVLVADNMYTSERELEEFKAYLTNHRAWASTTMDFESGVEFLVVQ